MNTTTSALLTGVIVTVGRWSQDKPLSARVVIAVLILAMTLSLLGNSSSKLAGQFGALVLVSAVFGYGPDILVKLGYLKKGAIKK